jgi:site-specific DNA-methyltransferase (adenine-specific)
VLAPYYDDGRARIYHGDLLEILHDLDGIGAVVTDPPYSSGGAFRADRTQQTTEKYVQTSTMGYRHEFAGDNRDQRSFAVWCTMWLAAALRASTPGAPLVSFIDWRQLPTLSDAVQAAGWIWRGVSTWWKPGIRMQEGAFSLSAEYLLTGSNGPRSKGRRSPQNVYSHAPIPGAQKGHVAEKPADVLLWALGVVPAGAVVLDPFLGSGSTLVAARADGLPCIGIDVDERCCELAATRLAQGSLLDVEAGRATEVVASPLFDMPDPDPDRANGSPDAATPA